MSKKLVSTSYVRDNYIRADLRTIRDIIKANCRFKYVNGRLLVIEDDIISWIESADYRSKKRVI